MPKKSKDADNTEELEEGECGNCGEESPLKECENCNEKFCEDCLNKKGECEKCGASDPLTCKHCDNEIEEESEVNSCPQCNELFCNEEDCWNSELNQCSDCVEEERSDWNQCEGCDKKFPPEVDLVECWKCEEEFGDNCCATTATLNDREINLCQDCYQKI